MSNVSSTSSNRRDGARGGQGNHGSEGGGGSSSTLAGASAKARQLSSDAVETVTQQAKRLLDGQLETGADMIASVAGATRHASKELEQSSPQIARLVQSIADRADAYSGELREQSIEDVMRAASQFTRRQPALVFGLAAVAGFVAWRVVKAAPISSDTVTSPSIQPYKQETRTRPSHGTRTY